MASSPRWGFPWPPPSGPSGAGTASIRHPGGRDPHEFVRSQASSILACDFLTVDMCY
jgi:hypothetical protein